MNRINVISWVAKSPERHITLSFEPVEEIFVIGTLRKLEKGSYLSYLSNLWKQVRFFADFCIRSKFKLKMSTMALSKEATVMLWANLCYALIESGIMTPSEFANISSEVILNGSKRIPLISQEIEKIKNEKALNS